MKKLFFLLLFPIFTYGITLEQLIETAVQNSPYLKEKRLEIKIKKSEKNVVKGSRFGEIKLFGTVIRYEDDRVLYPITPPINPVTLTGAQNQLILGVRYDLPLFTGFRITNQIKISEINRRVKRVRLHPHKGGTYF
ncbi:MAG: TolC family protein [Persephonella sp.]|nr:TolC family protein [Persephonella sp.]